MKPIYCPICTKQMDMERGCLMCTGVDRTLRKSTTEWIFQSLRNVKEVEPVEVTDISDEACYCPNCKTQLIEFDDMGRNYSCEKCGLKLRAMSHFDFEDLEQIHNYEPWNVE